MSPDVLLMNECYRHGLDDKNAFIIDSLDFYENSFTAFILVWRTEEECLVNLTDDFAYSMEDLPNYRVQVGAADCRFVEAVHTEKGLLWDRVSAAKVRRYAAGDDVVIFVGGSIYEATADVKIRRIEVSGDNYLYFSKRVPVSYHKALPQAGKYLELWQHPTCVARYYDVEAYGREHLQILDSYMAYIGALGVNNISLIMSDAPWDGQRKHTPKYNVFENNIIKVISRKPLRLDFSRLENYLALAHKHQIGPDLDVFGLIGLWHQKGPRVYAPVQHEGEQAFLEQEEIAAYISAIYNYFVEKNYIDNVYLYADEPKDYLQLQSEIAHFRSTYPRFKIKMAFDDEDSYRQLAPLCDKVSSSFFLAAKGIKEYSEAFYICCGPEEPNSFISSPLIEIRALAYLSKRMGFSTLLRWSAFAIYDNVCNDGNFAAVFRAGDSFLIYPGAYGEAETSLRYYQFLRFREDMALLAAAGCEAMQLLEEVCPIDIAGVLLPDYQVKSNFMQKNYEVYRALKNKLSELT